MNVPYQWICCASREFILQQYLLHQSKFSQVIGFSSNFVSYSIVGFEQPSFSMLTIEAIIEEAFAEVIDFVKYFDFSLFGLQIDLFVKPNFEFV